MYAGGTCYCDNQVYNYDQGDRLVDGSNCNASCLGNPQETCGGGPRSSIRFYLNIYAIAPSTTPLPCKGQ